MFKYNMLLTLSISAAFGLSNIATAADDEHHEVKKNIVGVFGGFTSVSGHTDGTFGLEYERKLTDTIGVGVIYEHTPNAHGGDGTSIYMGQVHLHPWKELRLSAGYGKEVIHYDGAHSEDVWRVGVAYDFHVGKIGIAPAFNLDRVNGHTAKVFGVALTKAF